jgi:hypothetical protein
MKVALFKCKNSKNYSNEFLIYRVLFLLHGKGKFINTADGEKMN